MAVYERTYRGYAGRLTPERSRFLILPRYAFRDVFRSRLFTAFFAACFIWPAASAVLIYLRHNFRALAQLGLVQSQILAIDAGFFLWFLRIQGAVLGFLLALVVGPALVSPDLRNNALALYLARPFSRKEYVAGKMSVLASLLSLITWIPGLLLFLLHGYLEGGGWLVSHLRIAAAILLGSWIWILFLSLLALAVSALVKWKFVASATLLGIFVVASALGTTINEVFGKTWGSLLDLGLMIQTVWAWLFGVAPPTEVPVWCAWVSLVAVCVVCLGILARRIRAYEVVR